MSLIGKLLGRHEDDPYTEGIALYEQGRYAEAADRFRGAALRRHGEGAGSLASFYRRQSLTGEGRRLLQAGRPREAVPYLAEATAEWDRFPDLHCLLGVAQALSGAWADALDSAGRALRRNPDYVEARLLEAAALARLQRKREAASSLDKLCEAGRRVDHPLIERLRRPGGFAPDSLPDLEGHLARLAGGSAVETDLASAVALCRAGRWEEGVVRLRALCAERPAWPDYRLKLAAALFQTGRDDEALVEIEGALALNPRYAAASHLKALLLADQGRFAAARDVMAACPALPGAGGDPHETLLASYLAAVLALLTGRAEEALAVLEPWGDLTLTFPRGELVRCAAEDLLGRDAGAAQRLAGIAAAWPADADYVYLHVCQLLRRGDLAAAERALGRWPAGQPGEDDGRPLLLAAHLAVARGRPAAVETLPGGHDGELARRFLEIRMAGLRGQWEAVREGAVGLWEQGCRTERVALLMTAAMAAGAVAGATDPPTAWPAPETVPESVVPHLIWLLNRAERSPEAMAVCRRHRVLHGEDPRWQWLWPPLWLEPVRRWIG